MEMELELLRQIRLVDALYRRTFHAILDPEGKLQLPPRGHGHGKILHALAKSDGMTQKALAERLQIRPQSLTDALERLEAQGYITRARSETDRRERFVRITPEGMKHAEELQKLRHAAANQLFSSLSDEQKEQLFSLMQQVLSAETEVRDV